MRGVWLAVWLTACQADLVRERPIVETPAQPPPVVPRVKTPIEMLASATFGEVQEGRRQLLRDREGSLPLLVAMVDRDERVSLEGTADLIYPGAKKGYGHGWIVNYDLDALADRAGWVLEELTFHDFGFTDGVSGQLPIDPATNPARLARARESVHAWWAQHRTGWSCYPALVTEMHGPTPRAAYAWLLDERRAACEGFTAAKFRVDLLPIVKAHRRDPKHAMHAYAVDLLADLDTRLEALVARSLDIVIARMKATTATTTVAELEQSLGASLRDIGSGIHIFVYDVDGDQFRVGSPDGTKVMYIRHVHAGTETVLYGAR